MTPRQTQILDAATTLFLRDGVGVSTARIAEAAEVSNGSLFNAFPSKQALIDALYRRAKIGLFSSIPHSGDAPFDRAHMRDNWEGCLAWARAHPEARAVMHLLQEADLVSAEARADIDAQAQMHGEWIARALAEGRIKAPNVAFVSRLVFFQIDLVITETRERAEAEMAFDMLCNALGVSR